MFYSIYDLPIFGKSSEATLVGPGMPGGVTLVTIHSLPIMYLVLRHVVYALLLLLSKTHYPNVHRCLRVPITNWSTVL